MVYFIRYEKPHQATWSDISEKFLQMCPNILALVDLVLTLPASSADAERGFNRLKITKSDWRSRLHDKHLSDLMMIMLESAEVKSFDPLPAIHYWNETPRRVREKKEVVQPLPVADPVEQGEAEIVVAEEADEADEAESELDDEDYYSDDDYMYEDQDDIIAKNNFCDRVVLAKKALARLNELVY